MLGHGTNTVSDGLVFSYDMGDKARSYMGGPTTNYAYEQNPRIDSSYSQWVYTLSGTWPVNHSSAIQVYNDNGTDISNYVNTGVTNWTNTYHAIWTYDPVLKRPVVTMRDVDGEWKAKSFGLSGSFSSWGLSNGSQYTISWLSWTDDLTKCANAGIYRYSTANSSWGFWDGQSNSQSTAFNTQLKTWQRVYATFTVSSSADIGSSISCYMYGHYGNRGTVKIADVQIEPLAYPTAFSKTLTRSTSNVLYDLTKQKSIVATSLNYTNIERANFTSSSNSIQVASDAFTISDAKTMSIWIRSNRPLSDTDNWQVGFLGQGSTEGSMFGWMYGVGQCQDLGYWGYGAANDASVESYTNKWSSDGNWHNAVITMDSSKNVRVYIDGVAKQWKRHSDGVLVDYLTMPISTTNYFQINSNAAWNSGMTYVDLDIVMVYNRALTAAEVSQNFNALRMRFGV